MKSNRERLENNQKETTSHIESYLADNPQAHNTAEVRSGVKGAKGAIDPSSGITLLIAQLEEIRDHEHGVIRHMQNNKDGTKSLVRDARGASQPHPDSNTSRLISCLNYARGAEKLIDAHVPDDEQAHYKGLLREQINQLIDNYKDNKKIDNKEFNTELFTILHNAGIKGDIAKKVTSAAELMSLQDQQYHVSTVTSSTAQDGSKRSIVESDVMMLGLTGEQKTMLREIKRIGSNTAEIKKLGARYEWYKKLTPLEREVVRDNVDALIKGRVIPTQLRKMLPGLRNAHAKTTYGFDPKSTKLEAIQETMHTGTVSFHGKGDKQAVTNGNVAQLQTFAPAGKKVNINILNSPANPTGIDKSIVKQAGKATKKHGGSLSNTPFNWFRLISKNENKGFEKALYTLGDALENKWDEYGTISAYLKNGKNEKAAKEELEAITDEKVKRALERAMRAKKLMTTSHFLYDPNNSNLELVSEMKRLEFEMRKGALRAELGEDKCKEVINTLCASGKDRTGAAETETTRKAISDYLGFEMGHVHEENFKKQVAGQHTQFMASVNGGSRGCHGIKEETHRSLPTDPYHSVKGLYQKSSSFNKFKFDKGRVRMLKLFTAVSNFFDRMTGSNKNESAARPKPQTVKAAANVNAPARSQTKAQRRAKRTEQHRRGSSSRHAARIHQGRSAVKQGGGRY